MQSDYNLSLIKPLAGFPASKPTGGVGIRSGGELNMRFVGRRLALAALLAFSVITFGSVVQAQETDDPVKIEIYKRFYDNAKTNPNAAYPRT
jgi:hypothetical protein